MPRLSSGIHTNRYIHCSHLETGMTGVLSVAFIHLADEIVFNRNPFFPADGHDPICFNTENQYLT